MNDTTTSATHQTSAAEFDLRTVIKILKRRRFWALGIPLVTIVLGVIITARAPRIYRATAKVLIEQAAPEVLSGVKEVYNLGPATYWGGQEYMQTQYDVIKSRPVAQKVVGMVGLEPTTLAQELQAAGSESMVNRVSADPLRDLPPTLQSKLNLLGFDRLHSRAAILEALKNFDVVGYIQKRIEVIPLKESRLVNVSISDINPERATLITNAVVDAYVELNLDQRLDVTRSAVDWLSDQLHDLKSRLESSEISLYEYKRQNSMVDVSLEDRQSMISQTLSNLNEALSTTRAKRLGLESIGQQIKKTRAGGLPADSLETVGKGSLVQELKGILATLKREESELLVKYTDSHPKLMAVRDKSRQVQHDLDAEIEKLLRGMEVEYDTTLDTEHRISGAIEKIKAEALELNKKEIDYKRLLREKDNNQALYEMVIKRQKEADLTQMLRVNNIRKLESAIVPTRPVKPNVKLNMMLAVFLGLVLGLGTAFLVDYLDNTLKSQDQVEQVLQLPFLGIVPSIHPDKGAMQTQAPERDHFIVANPRSSVAECCRTIRTNLMFMSPDRPLHTILVTSTGPREGKSTTAINLAVTMAQSGARTLLIDTDMRRPRLHKSFSVTNEVGISSLIVGEVAVKDAIQSSSVPGLDVVPCGPIPPNPAELLHTEKFRMVVAELCKRYDRVIFDSPPVAAVTDALVLTAMVDGTVLVVHAGKTTWPAALEAKRRLAGVGGRIFGVVLNNVDLDSARANEYYQYYYYRYGYTSDDEKKPRVVNG